MKSANDYDWTSKEATDHLNTLTFKQLGKRLQLVREQMNLALKKGLTATADNLFSHEDAIIQARLIKFDIEQSNHSTKV